MGFECRMFDGGGWPVTDCMAGRVDVDKRQSLPSVNLK